MGRRLATAVVTIALIGTSRSAAAADGATIVIHVDDYVSAATNEMARAAAEASRIYAGIGVRLMWTNGATAIEATSGPSLHVHVLLLNQAMAQQMIDDEHRGDNVLGRAVPEALRAYIFYDRVSSVSGRYERLTGGVLGKVIAHEVGHLLLGHQHSPTGLMRAEPDLRSATIQFTKEQGKTIRAGILARLTTEP